MTPIEIYNNDGANYQAQAVMAFLKNITIEESWNDDARKYDAEIKVSRWENCREQGYVICMRTKDYSKQINIAFFEHRNSDNICAIKWEQITTNAPTIDTAEFGDVYKDKYDVSHSVGYGEIPSMSEWITNELEEFWENNS